MTMKKILAGLLIAGAGLGSSYGAFADNGERPLDTTSTNGSHGNVWYTAAINSTGTIAGCYGCTKSATSQLGTGEYQVDFQGNITAAAGFVRWVQVDTLTTGSTGAVYCTTADRAGLTSAVFVECFNAAGTATNTSFFLIVAR